MIDLAAFTAAALLAFAHPIPASPAGTETPDAFAERLAGADGKLSVDEVRLALAELEKLVAVQGDLAGAEERSDGLAAQLGEDFSGDPEDANDLLTARLVLASQVALRVQQNKLDEALAAFIGSEYVGGDHMLSVNRRVFWRNVIRDTELVTLKSYVDARIAKQPAVAPPSILGMSFDVADGTIDSAVLDALTEGDQRAIQEILEVLGSRAVPGLVQAVLSDLDSFPNQKPDALLLLVETEPGTAAELMRDHLFEGGFLWKKRVVRALVRGQSAWTLSNTRPAKWRFAAAREVMEGLIGDPDVGGDIIAVLPPVAEGSLSPKLLGGLKAALYSDDETARGAALANAVKHGLNRLSVEVLEYALQAPTVDARSRAARPLSKLADSQALAAHVDDPSEEVRLAVASMLIERVHVELDGDWGTNEVVPLPPLNESQLALVTKLLQAPEANVRNAALQTHTRWPMEIQQVQTASPMGSDQLTMEQLDVFTATPPGSLLLQLAQDPDPEVRRQLGHLCSSLPPTLGIDVAILLASDPDEDLARGLFWYLPTYWFMTEPVDAAQIPIAFLRRLSGDVELPNELRTSIKLLTRTHAGCDAIMPFLVERGPVMTHSAFSSGLGNDLDPEEVQNHLAPDLFTSLCLQLRKEAYEKTLIRLLDEPPARLNEALLSLAEDTKLSSLTRALSAVMAARNGANGWQTSLRQALHDPMWSQRIEDRDRGFRTMVKTYNSFEDERTIQFALEAMADPETHDRCLDDLIACSTFGAEGSLDLAGAIKSRWFWNQPKGAKWTSVRAVLSRMGVVPGLRDDAMIAAALEDTDYASTAVSTIADLRDPSLLPLLAQVLETHHGQREWARIWNKIVTEVLPSFLTDESAELLLQAAALAEDNSVRKTALDALESMRSYFLARDYWARRKQLVASKDEAIAKLLLMLDDENEVVRAEAARALGTFEAITAIPQLIELLNDPSAAVVAAATESLARLNREEAPPKSE